MIYIYIYIYIYIRVGWKVHRLTKMLSWNVTKWHLSLNRVLLAVHTLLQLVLQCLDPISQKVIISRYDIIICTFQATLLSKMNKSDMTNRNIFCIVYFRIVLNKFLPSVIIRKGLVKKILLENFKNIIDFKSMSTHFRLF